MLLDLHVGALVEPLTGRRWAADETRRRVDARVADYGARGFRPGERVFLHFGNSNEFFVELLAAWQMGGCVIPIDTSFTAFEIETLAGWAKPRFSIWNGAPEQESSAALSTLGVETVDLTALEGSPASAARQSPPGIRLDDDALILFTSGTTGQPKGVVHTHRSLRARWMSLRDHLGVDAYRRTLCLLPTHFGHGLVCNCLFPWLSGCDLYIQPPFRPELLAQLGAIVDEHEITFMSSVPSVWRVVQRIAKPPQTRSLERVSIGSAPLTAQLWRTVQEWSGTMDVFNAYGITETGSWLAGTTVPGFTPEDGLVGEAWGGLIRVLQRGEAGAPADPGSACKPGEPGHVWVNTPALMRGYLDREDLTANVVSNGWFVTGDIGVLDERGWLYLRGREREEINKGGMKVYPADIDAVIERFSATTDVCAFAFAEPILGEDVGVAVVLSETDPAVLIALHEWTAAHLAKQQMPQRWYLLSEIPRTSRGKVSRQTVAERCLATSPLSLAALRTELSARS
jgi:acyl-CoA synthetase (AMP-forming)/AMP-acid ligase II